MVFKWGAVMHGFQMGSNDGFEMGSNDGFQMGSNDAWFSNGEQ